MSVFTQQLNPTTGRLVWGLMPGDYDYKQEVARSAYADMLHDEERNNKYYQGLRSAVTTLRARGQPVHVLDIGTGTGLLSMMAVACGADSVTACEAFYPMAECARKGLEANGYAHKVKLVPKRSTELEVGPGRDLDQRATLLVAELFDTELIGEGAIDTYRHARDCLLTADALLVPWEGVVYAQVVASDMLQRWNKVSPVTRTSPAGEEEVVLVAVPPSVQQCPGAAAVHDLQLSQVPQEWFTPLSPPLQVFRFDWRGREIDLPTDDLTRVEFRALASGRCEAVLMWWELTFDLAGEVKLSCAPYWAHPDLAGQSQPGVSSGADIPWRDHWMQAVYFLPSSPPPAATPGQPLTLVAAHDEYSLWFNVEQGERSAVPLPRPVCVCGLHVISARTRLGQINDPRRRNVFVRVLTRLVTSESVVLALGDGCLMGVLAAKLGARHVYLTESSEAARRVMGEFIAANRVEDRVTLLGEDICDTHRSDLVGEITLVFSEPFFSTSLLPWHALYCWYARNSLSHLLSPVTRSLPCRMTLWGLPVCFRDLWKIRAPLRMCCGFKMDVFDELIETASNEADDPVEPQPLWEYPATAQGHPINLLTLDLTPHTLPQGPITRTATTVLSPGGHVNGVALWVDWHVSGEPGDVIGTGPLGEVRLGEEVCWDVYSRQGVYLFPAPQRLPPSSSAPHTLRHTTTFTPTHGTITFDFKIERQATNSNSAASNSALSTSNSCASISSSSSTLPPSSTSGASNSALSTSNTDASNSYASNSSSSTLPPSSVSNSTTTTTTTTTTTATATTTTTTVNGSS